MHIRKRLGDLSLVLFLNVVLICNGKGEVKEVFLEKALGLARRIEIEWLEQVVFPHQVVFE